MIRINTGADVDDLFGGQTDFEVAIEWSSGDDFEIIGAGHTVAEAVADARETLGAWRRGEERNAIEEAMIAERGEADRVAASAAFSGKPACGPCADGRALPLASGFGPADCVFCGFKTGRRVMRWEGAWVRATEEATPNT